MKTNADRKNQAGEKSNSDRCNSVADLREKNYGLSFSRAVGNQGLRRLLWADLKSLQPASDGAGDVGLALAASRKVFGANPPLTLQAKLTVNAPGDTYEQEADRIADRVTNMSESCCNEPAPVTVVNVARCGNETGTTDRVQTKRSQANSAGATTAPSIVHEVVNSPGHPLDAASRSFMESRFGYDFSRVRIHDDVRAGESVRSVNALAYTVGENVVFGEGRYDPQSSSGRRLLAHELAHVVQQAGDATCSRHLQRAPDGPKEPAKPKQQVKRLDVAVIGEGWPGADELGGLLAPSAKLIKVKSIQQLVTELSKIDFPIGRLFIIAHSAPSGALQFGTAEGTIKPNDIAGKLKGALSPDRSPEVVDFRGCSLGTTPKAMNQIASALGAKSVIAGDCFAVIQRSNPPLKLDGEAITQSSQITDPSKDENWNKKRRELFKSLLEGTANRLGGARKCIMNPGERGYFATGGHFVALWFNRDHEDSGKWIPGKSVCYKDVKPETVDPDKALAASAGCRVIRIDAKGANQP